MKLVYICSAYDAETPEEMERGRQSALAACAEAYQFGRLGGQFIVPVTPLVNFAYFGENDPAERGWARKLGLALMSKCGELWVAGENFSEGMRGEIRAAARLGLPVFSMGMAQEKIQAAIDGMPPMLDERSCLKGSDRADYTGQLLALKPSALAPWAMEPENQLWLAESGFGLSPTARGRAVYAACLYDGEKARFDRSDFLGIADREKLPDWADDKLTEFEQNMEESEEWE
ncbi:MAG: hypothetical protein LBK41_00390 [Clostridiales bacterium]|nr:hypothetical protein [Clostridiales bacterium]